MFEQIRNDPVFLNKYQKEIAVEAWEQVCTKETGNLRT